MLVLVYLSLYSIMTELGPDRPLSERLESVTRRYFDLGFTSFGGPGVHVIILRQRFVDRLKWVDERTFLDLFALGNALPGPGSTQLAFSIAVVTNGILPGLLAFLLWSLPGAVGMVAVGVGVNRIPDELPGPVLSLFTGLNAAAVGLIALAAFQLGTAAGTDRISIGLIWLSASFGICYHAPWMYPVLIAAGGIVTLVWDFRRQIWRAITRKGRVEERDGASGQGVESGIEMNTLETDTRADIERRITSSPSHTGVASGSDDKYETSTYPSNQPEDPITHPYPSPAASPIPTRRRLPRTENRSTESVHPQPSTATTESASSRVLAAEPESNKLKVVSIPFAIALISGFVLLLTIPLATRAGLSNAGKDIPRGLDVRIRP